MAQKHIISFKGENHSGYKDLNLLYNKDNIYVMDNHNAAMWCWLQKIDTNKKHSLIHIDRHHDTRDNHIDIWINRIENNIKEIGELTINEYLELSYSDPNFNYKTEIMQWDTYFPIFHKLFGFNCVEIYHFFTHDENVISDILKPHTKEYPMENMILEIKNIISHTPLNNGIILNIDLDYFYREKDDSNDTFKCFTDKEINDLIDIIKDNIKTKITVLTIALSPEFCGGWQGAKKILNLFKNKLEIEV
jgi:hypothetical protein